MNCIKTFCVAIALTAALALSSCQHPQKASASVQPQPAPAAPTNDKPCSGQASAPEPWIYNHHSEWELPGAAVPEIYAAAKTVLLEDWKMPRQGDTRNESQYIDFLSASIKISSALNTVFDVSIIKLNEKSSRLAIDAKSKQIPPAQLEEHCSLMYTNIIHYLNTAPEKSPAKKQISIGDRIYYYSIQECPLEYPVKNVFDAAKAVLEQMHTSISNSVYDDFAARIFFTTGNKKDSMIDIQMIAENKCLAAYLSRSGEDELMEKWSDIFIQRLRQKLTEPQPAAASSSTPESKPPQNIYYSQNNRPASITKTLECPYTVEQIDNFLRSTLKHLNIGLSNPLQRDAITSKLNFKTANSADWWVTISQTTPDQSKVLFSATNIWSEDFEKYTTTIIGNLEKQFQQPEKPATQSSEPAQQQKKD